MADGAAQPAARISDSTGTRLKSPVGLMLKASRAIVDRLAQRLVTGQQHRHHVPMLVPPT